MGTIKFFRESVKNLKTVGTITRSSKYLCKGMIKPVDFSKAKVLVELGAGDGVVTKHILENMRKDAKLLAFELNPKFCEQIREIQDERLIIPHPGMTTRNFVLIPLAELDPNIVLPDNSSLQHWLNQCSEEGITTIEHA